MVRRNNSYGKWSAFTSAARIAIAQNNRETLLLARKNEGLTSESDGAVRAFYREKSKANSFLQKVHEHRKKSFLLQPKWDENGNVLAEKVINVKAKTEENHRPVRLPSLDNSQKQKSREQVRELDGVPLLKSNNDQMESPKERNSGNKLESKVEQLQKSRSEFMEAWVLNEWNSGNKLKKDIFAESKEREGKNKRNKGRLKEETGVNELEENSSEPKKEANVRTTKRPFKVRSRATSVCFSCHNFHLRNLPSVYGPNIERKWSDELRLNDRAQLFEDRLTQTRD